MSVHPYAMPRHSSARTQDNPMLCILARFSHHISIPHSESATQQQTLISAYATMRQMITPLIIRSLARRCHTPASTTSVQHRCSRVDEL